MMPDERDQNKVVDRRHGIGVRGGHLGVVEIPGGEREHAEALLRQLLIGGQDVAADVRRSGPARRARARSRTGRGRRRARP